MPERGYLRVGVTDFRDRYTSEDLALDDDDEY